MSRDEQRAIIDAIRALVSLARKKSRKVREGSAKVLGLLDSASDRLRGCVELTDEQTFELWKALNDLSRTVRRGTEPNELISATLLVSSAMSSATRRATARKATS